MSAQHRPVRSEALRADRATLEAGLAAAEAALRAAVAEHGGNGPHTAVAEEALERARGQCRMLRAALDRLNIQEGRPKGFRADQEPRAAPNPPPAQRAAAARPSRRIAPRKAESRGARASVGAAWHGVEALSLALAYLVYYYAGVYQQIASLPSAQVVAQGGRPLFG